MIAHSLSVTRLVLAAQTQVRAPAVPIAEPRCTGCVGLQRSGARVGHVVTEGWRRRWAVPVSCGNGQQAQLLLRPAHQESLPLRGLTMANVKAQGWSSVEVSTKHRHLVPVLSSNYVGLLQFVTWSCTIFPNTVVTWNYIIYLERSLSIQIVFTFISYIC